LQSITITGGFHQVSGISLAHNFLAQPHEQKSVNHL